MPRGLQIVYNLSTRSLVILHRSGFVCDFAARLEGFGAEFSAILSHQSGQREGRPDPAPPAHP
jgi:hypothetical protein